MSALKFQPSLRYINSYKKSPHICSLPTSHNIVTCHNGSLSSSVPGGTGTRNQQKDDNNDTIKNESKIIDDENKKGAPLSHQALEKDSAAFGKFVPLKMAEVNKYFTETSRRLLRIRFNKGLSNIVFNINNNNNDNSNNDDKKNFEERKVNTYSFEQTMMKMNESVVSFYDTSCAKESPQDQIINQQKELGMQDDDQPQIPRYVGPLFTPKFPPEVKKKRAEARRAEKISRLSLESRTKALVQSLRKSHSLMSKLTRAEELCDHLIAHPECVWDAAKVKGLTIKKRFKRD